MSEDKPGTLKRIRRNIPAHALYFNSLQRAVSFACAAKRPLAPSGHLVCCLTVCSALGWRKVNAVQPPGFTVC